MDHLLTTKQLSVTIDPIVLFSILDHSLRRSPGQERIIGTLLGTRSQDGTEVEIKSSFAVPHIESTEQVEVDMEYHKSMYALHLKANPREVLVGWYATTSDLNAFSALIQNFYASPPDGTYPHPAVHLTMNTDPTAGMKIQTYVSSSVGVVPEKIADSCLFVPVQYEIRQVDGEKAALDAIMPARDSEDRIATLTSDMDNLRESIKMVISMLDRVSHYVKKVINGDEPANEAVGHFLMDALSVRPNIDVNSVEKMFNGHLQDVLMVTYLSNTIRTQLDIGSKLATIS